MNERKGRVYGRRNLLIGSSMGIAGSAISFLLGTPTGRSQSPEADDGGRFLMLATDDPLPPGVLHPEIPLILEGNGPDATAITEIPAAEFRRRARIPMRALPESPAFYEPAVYRVAENLSGAVPFASITYELLDAEKRHPRSILSIVGKPAGAFLNPFPVRGASEQRQYPWGLSHEVHGRNSRTHFWFENNSLYIFMHINYDEGRECVPLRRSAEIVASLQSL